MSVMIRLTREGKRATKIYRIIAIDKKNKRDGKALDFLGSYIDSKTNPKFTINEKKLSEWVARGALVSPTVRDLVKNTKKS